jgi:hypothetical protein
MVGIWDVQPAHNGASAYEHAFDPRTQDAILHDFGGQTLDNSCAVRFLEEHVPVAQLSKEQMSLSVQATGAGSQFPLAKLQEYVVHVVLAWHNVGVYWQPPAATLHAALSQLLRLVHTVSVLVQLPATSLQE